MKNNIKVKNLVLISILGVMSFLLMFFDFPLPIAPTFYKMDFASVPILIGGFMMGPIAGLSIEIIRSILKIFILSSSTYYIGELSGFIVNASFVLTAATIYKYSKSKYRLSISLFAGSIAFSIIAALSNYYLIIPFYVSAFNYKIDDIVYLGKLIYPFVDNLFSFIIIIVIPFNLVKSIAQAIIAGIVSKRLKRYF